MTGQSQPSLAAIVAAAPAAEDQSAGPYEAMLRRVLAAGARIAPTHNLELHGTRDELAWDDVVEDAHQLLETTPEVGVPVPVGDQARHDIAHRVAGISGEPGEVLRAALNDWFERSHGLTVNDDATWDAVSALSDEIIDLLVDIGVLGWAAAHDPTRTTVTFSPKDAR